MNSDLFIDITKKAKYILEKDKEETGNEIKLREIIKIIFDIVSEDTKFKDLDNSYKEFISRFINLIDSLFHLEKEERHSILETDVSCIKDKNIYNNIKELEKAQNLELSIENKNLAYLCDKIVSLKKKEKYSLFQYIDAIIGNMIYISYLKNILRYEIYCLLMDKYFIPFFKEGINFNETEINVDEQISFELIIDLLENVKIEEIKLLQTIIILKYESERESIMNCNIDTINKALENTLVKIKQDKTISKAILFEKIIIIFNEEIDELKNKSKKKRKKKNKNKKKTKQFNNNTNAEEETKSNSKIIIYEYDPKKKVKKRLFPSNESANTEEQKANVPVNNNEIIDINKDNKGLNNNKIDDKAYDNEILLNKNNKKDTKFGDNIKKNIIDLLNKILFMDSEEDKLKHSSEIKDIIFKLIDEHSRLIEEKIENEINLLKQNNKFFNDNLSKEIESLKEKNISLNDKIDEMNDKIDELKKENKNLTDEIDELKESSENMEKKLQEIKEVLGTIQISDLSKNFLKTFNKYLTWSDFLSIFDDYSKKGEIIVNRIKKKFSAFAKSKKMDIIQNLILSSFNSLEEGNRFAHSIIMDNFEKDMEEYKRKNNLKSLSSPEIIVFLLGLGIEENYFDDCAKFLRSFFNDKFKLKQKINFLETYFK